MGYKKVLIIVLLFCIIIATIKPSKKEHMTVAVMPNQFIQSNDQNGGNDLNNQMDAQFGPDQMNLAQFFNIGQCWGKYYPKTRKIVNDFNAVPLVL